MCASVSHGVTSVINGANGVNPINGEPPGTNVQTNLAEQGVSKTKPIVTKPQKPAASAVTQSAKMGNQQGAESGKNQHGSKKKEKKDTSQTSKSNSPTSEATSHKSKSPSVKKKSSPASPSKKVFKKKQPFVKQDPKEDVSKAKEALAADQQYTQDVFTDARETMNCTGQNDQEKSEKAIGDSSSDNISFESVSCGTPLRVATPRVQRAQAKVETTQLTPANPVDSVDELGKCIERAIMERFSDDPSIALEGGSQSEVTFGDGKDLPVEHENVSERHEEGGKTIAPQRSCKASNISNAPDSSPATLDVTKPREISKPIRKIKIEPVCVEQGVGEKSKSDATKDIERYVEITCKDESNTSVSHDTNIVTPTAVERVSMNKDISKASVSEDTNIVTPSAVEDVATDKNNSSACVSKDTNIVGSSTAERVGAEFVTKIAQSDTKYVDSENSMTKPVLDATRPSQPTEDIEMCSTNKAQSKGIFERDVEPEIYLKEITPSPVLMESLEGKETKVAESVKHNIDEVSVNSPEKGSQILRSAVDVTPSDVVSDTITTTDLNKPHLRGSEKSDTESSDVSPVTDISEDSQTPLFISEPDIIRADGDKITDTVHGNSESIGKESVVTEARAVSCSDKQEAVKPRSLPARRWPSADTSSAIEPSGRSMTLAEKRQHRLTDPLVDTLLLLIKQTMESDDIDSQISAKTTASKIVLSKTGNIPDVPKRPQVPSQGNPDEKRLCVTEDAKGGEDADKTLTPEDMVEIERLKQQAMAVEESEEIGGMNDDTLTQKDLAEFDRLKKEMSKDAKDSENFPLHVEDRFELSSGETTEDSVIEKPVQKAPDLETTKEEKVLESQAMPGATSFWEETQPEKVVNSPEIRIEPKSESPVVRKRSLTEEEIRREIRKFMIPEMKESLPNGGSMKQMLHDLHDITPTSEFYPSMDDRDSTDSPEPGNSSGVRSRTSITSSELDISEQRDDMSTGTDSMYADDEDDSSSEVLFCKTYTEPVRGAEVLVSCTVVNSALKEGNSSSDEFWAENSAAEDAYQQVEFAAAAVNHHFTHARSQMQDIQHHLQALKYQMRDMEKQVVKTNTQPTDEFAFDGPERRAVTD
ncbi:uncharacterized protein LOC135461825 [Liolophura sinensis]|uniref:uncharacterized protein LOC135461825 n=1 Tax=Liolophura sinensis TaxID=3198878 RepID=UPI0031594D55